MNFLRNLLASILGGLIVCGIFVAMFFILAALISSADDGVNVKRNSILELQIENPISDYVGKNEADPFAAFANKSQGLNEILHAIRIAKEDDKIKGISINNNFIIAGMAQTQAIRKALENFKESDKFIYTYGDFYMQKDYYLSSVADSIYLNPAGGLDFKGLSAEVLFYKDLQEKTGIKMEVIRHGKYKSAVEPYLYDEMSDANRTQIKELIGSIWETMVVDISKGRSISEKDLNNIADTLGGRTPKMAKSSGLIDGVLFYDEYENRLRQALKIEEKEDINYVKLSDYTVVANKKKINKGKDKIAVIYAQGQILYGEGGPSIIGQGIMTKALIKAREDDKVKAVVLRVNSPGGSPLVSDIIWREIELTKEVKPVVVSMGNVAASGGYYIACGADKIFAEPTTITGSIGVFGVLPNISKLAENIGINAEQVGTNKNSVDYSFYEPMSDSFRNVVHESIEDIYETFLERVSVGRGMTIEQADSIAQGRVWSGVDAKRLGLVDELGGLDDAIAEAASMANLESYRIKNFPKYKSGFEKFMEDIVGASMKGKEAFIEKEIGTEMYTAIKRIKEVMDQKGVQVRMPFELIIK